MIWVLSLERELLAVIDLLAASAIETRILKGTAVTHLNYSQPAIVQDLDVLVRPEDIERTVHVLVTGGFVRRPSEPRPGFDRWFDKGTTLLSPTGYELDLHRTFVLGPWGLLVDLAGLWDGGQEFVIGGRPVLASQQRRTQRVPQSARRVRLAAGRQRWERFDTIRISDGDIPSRNDR